MIDRFLNTFVALAACDGKHKAIALYPLLRLAKGCGMIKCMIDHPSLKYDDTTLTFIHDSGATLQFGTVHSKYDVQRYMGKGVKQIAMHNGCSEDAFKEAVDAFPSVDIVVI